MDDSYLRALIAALESPNNSVELIEAIGHLFRRSAAVKLELLSAGCAGEDRIVLKPTEALIPFLAAMHALNGHIEQICVGPSISPEVFDFDLEHGSFP